VTGLSSVVDGFDDLGGIDPVEIMISASAG
jgi:hypothetical protein